MEQLLTFNSSAVAKSNPLGSVHLVPTSSTRWDSHFSDAFGTAVARVNSDASTRTDQVRPTTNAAHRAVRVDPNVKFVASSEEHQRKAPGVGSSSAVAVMPETVAILPSNSERAPARTKH